MSRSRLRGASDQSRLCIREPWGRCCEMACMHPLAWDLDNAEISKVKSEKRKSKLGYQIIYLKISFSSEEIERVKRDMDMK